MSEHNADGKTRAFLFTLFNHEDQGMLRHFMSQLKTVYWGAGDEICPSTGKQHWQGWMYFKAPRMMGKLTKIFKGNGSVMPCRGCQEANEIYTGKDHKFIEEGVKPKQGKRKDLQRASEFKNVRKLYKAMEPNYQQVRVLEKKLEYCIVPKWRDVKYSVLTVEEVKALDHKDLYYFSGNWHGYDGQKTVVYEPDDSFYMLEVSSGKPMRIPVGGTSRMLEATHIIKMIPSGTEVTGGNIKTPVFQDDFH